MSCAPQVGVATNPATQLDRLVIVGGSSVGVAAIVSCVRSAAHRLPAPARTRAGRLPQQRVHLGRLRPQLDVLVAAAALGRRDVCDAPARPSRGISDRAGAAAGATAWGMRALADLPVAALGKPP